MAETWQEMHCTECQVYFGLHLDDAFTGVVEVRCGVCKHIHRRYVEKGWVKEEGRYDRGKPIMQIEIMRSQCYPESRTAAMKRAQTKHPGNVRDAHPAKGESEVGRELTDAEKVKRAFIEELWLDRFARDQYQG
jgi:hypothetical protein